MGFRKFLILFLLLTFELFSQAKIDTDWKYIERGSSSGINLPIMFWRDSIWTNALSSTLSGGIEVFPMLNVDFDKPLADVQYQRNFPYDTEWQTAISFNPSDVYFGSNPAGKIMQVIKQDSLAILISLDQYGGFNEFSRIKLEFGQVPAGNITYSPSNICYGWSHTLFAESAYIKGDSLMIFPLQRAVSVGVDYISEANWIVYNINSNQWKRIKYADQTNPAAVGKLDNVEVAYRMFDGIGNQEKIYLGFYTDSHGGGLRHNLFARHYYGTEADSILYGVGDVTPGDLQWTSATDPNLIGDSLSIITKTYNVDGQIYFSAYSYPKDEHRLFQLFPISSNEVQVNEVTLPTRSDGLQPSAFYPYSNKLLLIIYQDFNENDGGTEAQGLLYNRVSLRVDTLDIPNIGTEIGDDIGFWNTVEYYNGKLLLARRFGTGGFYEELPFNTDITSKMWITNFVFEIPKEIVITEPLDNIPLFQGDTTRVLFTVNEGDAINDTIIVSLDTTPIDTLYQLVGVGYNSFYDFISPDTLSPGTHTLTLDIVRYFGVEATDVLIFNNFENKLLEILSVSPTTTTFRPSDSTNIFITIESHDIDSVSLFFSEDSSLGWGESVQEWGITSTGYFDTTVVVWKVANISKADSIYFRVLENRDTSIYILPDADVSEVRVWHGGGICYTPITESNPYVRGFYYDPSCGWAVMNTTGIKVIWTRRDEIISTSTSFNIDSPVPLSLQIASFTTSTELRWIYENGSLLDAEPAPFASLLESYGYAGSLPFIWGNYKYYDFNNIIYVDDLLNGVDSLVYLEYGNLSSAEGYVPQTWKLKYMHFGAEIYKTGLGSDKVPEDYITGLGVNFESPITEERVRFIQDSLAFTQGGGRDYNTWFVLYTESGIGNGSIRTFKTLPPAPDSTPLGEDAISISGSGYIAIKDKFRGVHPKIWKYGKESGVK